MTVFGHPLPSSFFTQNTRQQASEAYPYAFAQRAADGEFVWRYLFWRNSRSDPGMTWILE